VNEGPLDRVTGPPTEFHHRVIAAAEHLVELRHALQRWVAASGLSRHRQEDVVLASYEAMANSAEHGYRDRPGGSLDVHATHDGAVLVVTVVDYGQWKPPEPSDGLRGRGLMLIGTLADETSTMHRTDGTTVTMTWRVR
jgi:serine/threonine-protein kinase RsbW